jgi:hypothetical protein
MTDKDVGFDDNACSRLLRGIARPEGTVRVTLGQEDRNVVLQLKAGRHGRTRIVGTALDHADCLVTTRAMNAEHAGRRSGPGTAAMA